MELFRSLALTGLFSLGVAIMGGCSTPLPPEEQEKYGLLIPAENNSTMISDIDGDSKFGLSGKTYDVPPGQHKVKVTTCFGSSNNCQKRNYTFDVKPGFAYKFRGINAVYVYSRFHTDSKTPLYTLVKQPDGILAPPPGQ